MDHRGQDFEVGDFQFEVPTSSAVPRLSGIYTYIYIYIYRCLDKAPPQKAGIEH